MVGRPLQYGELAKYYDALYEWKDYAKETRVLQLLIERYKRSPGITLVDVGCGTGKHIEHLTNDFECVGVDSSESMLAQARRRVKGVEFVLGDMVNLDLGRSFDVILCLFSAIGYVRTYPKLGRTLRNFAKHLRPGGVVIIEPWITKTAWKSGLVHILSNQSSNDLKVVRVDYTGIRGSLSVIDERTLVAEKDKGISYYRERQLMGLFDQGKFLRLMRKAGLEARYLKKSLSPGRGLYVGTKGVA